MATKNRFRPISLYQCIQGHHLWCNSRKISPRTIADYTNTFTLFTQFIDPNTPLDDITEIDIQAFLQHMAETPVDILKGAVANYTTTKKPRRRSAKTLQNYHTALSSLWTYATKHNYAHEHIPHQVTPPKVHKKPIIPLTQEQAIQLLRATNNTRQYHNKPGTTNHRATHERDRAIIGLLLETGLRASELCNLRIKDVTFTREGGSVYVKDGKGEKDRAVPFAPRCASWLHAWLMIRPDLGNDDEDGPFFCNQYMNKGLSLDRRTLGSMVKRLGKKVGLRVNPHLLRTTAACLMVQNGVTAWELQRIMGHSDINTTMRYVKAANVDLVKAMKRASPLSKLRL